MSYLFATWALLWLMAPLPSSDVLCAGQHHVPHCASGSVLWNAPVSVDLFRTVYAQCTCYHLRKPSELSAAMVGVLPPSRVLFDLP